MSSLEKKELENPQKKEESGLERIVSTVKTQAKEYAVDTSISMIYGNIVFGASEYFVAGMESDEFIKTRISMNILSLVISRPYAKFREYWSKKCNTDAKSSRTRKFLTEVSGNVLFFSPIYSTIMYGSGASFEEISIAAVTGASAAIVTARPYGWCLDKWRKLFGVKPTLDTYIEKESSTD